MSNDDRNLLDVLESELQFLKQRGYWQSPNAPWRPGCIFEDSPTCMNYKRTSNLRPCTECVLMRFVPPDCRSEPTPCRHITLNAEGFTIDTYYRLGTHEEVEIALANWLRKTIEQLEQERERPPACAAEAARSE